MFVRQGVNPRRVVIHRLPIVMLSSLLNRIPFQHIQIRIVQMSIVASADKEKASGIEECITVDCAG